MHGNDLAVGAMNTHRKVERLEPGITEANVTYFGFLLVNCLSVLLIPTMYTLLSKDVSIMLAIVFLVLSIPLFIAGIKLTAKSPKFKFLYYFDFFFLAISVLMSVLAISSHFKTSISFEQSIIIFIILASVSLLDLVSLSIGKKERLIFSLMSLVFIAVIVLSFVGQSFGVSKHASYTLLAYAVVLLILHLTMLTYVVSGERFFIVMSFAYLFIAMVALIVAMLVSGSGDCSCDCADCALPAGGRRGKVKKMPGARL